ncbi:MAG: hypothetical protein HQK65_18000 [Desulfamplus sp.]|nr:hypothetical protein [Desulfamplus sp.]
MEKKLNGKKRLIDDFTISNSDDASDISAALYKEELNGQKIERLGNRLTIVAVLVPCLIGTILVYAYLDIKKKVMVIHDSGQTQVDIVAKEFEIRLNAFEVELAKIKFAIEKDIPELKQQAIAIQDELTLLAGTKSDKEETDKNINIIKTSVDKVADQYQGALHILDRTNQETLAIVNENSKELEAKIEDKIASLKTLQSEIEDKVASAKDTEAIIENKINSQIDSAMEKKVKTAVNEKLASQSQALNKKIADIELSVESKLATLTEATQILAENKNTIIKLEKSIDELGKNIALMEKELENSQKSNIITNKSDIDKQYVDNQLIAINKSLNAKIDQLNLKLSRKILQYATQLEILTRQNDSGTKKKTESTRQDNKPELILKNPERGKISETDLIR